MDSITVLLSQYNTLDMVVFFFVALVAIKAVDELFTYFWGKLKTHFQAEQAEEDEHKALISRLEDIGSKLEKTNTDIEALNKRLQSSERLITAMDGKVHSMSENIRELNEQSKKTEESLSVVQERLQNQARDRLIESHHKYVYEFGMIDDYGLQSMERTYLDYKAGGGNTFIDTLMDEVRALPRPAFEKEEVITSLSIANK